MTNDIQIIICMSLHHTISEAKSQEPEERTEVTPHTQNETAKQEASTQDEPKPEPTQQESTKENIQQETQREEQQPEAEQSQGVAAPVVPQPPPPLSPGKKNESIQYLNCRRHAPHTTSNHII